MLLPGSIRATPALRLRPAIEGLPSSKIREIAHAGIGRADHIPLWFGEPDTPTPPFICDAAARALAAGDTFYQPNAGIHELRLTLAEYMNRLYGTRLAPENVIVSASAINALMLAMQALVDPGDVVVTTTPSWPNLPAVPQILSGAVRAVPLTPGDAGWRLDLDRLFDACDDRTPGVLPQFAQQPDRLDDVGRATAGGAGVRAPARHLDRERRGLRADRLRSPFRAVVPRARRAARPGRSS